MTLEDYNVLSMTRIIFVSIDPVANTTTTRLWVDETEIQQVRTPISEMIFSLRILEAI